MTVSLALLLAACGFAPATERSRAGSSPSPSTRDIQGCPVTIPPRPGFTPPKPYPPDPGFGKVWHGSPALWTKLEPDGQIWRDIPVGKDGSIGDKMLWFSTKFSTASNEDFSGNAEITITAERLDAFGPKVVQEGAVPSFNRDIKNFMLTGVGLQPGCWEVTATYQGAELAYTLMVKG